MMNPLVPFPSVAKPVNMTRPRPIIGPTERSTPAVSRTTSWPIPTRISAVESSSRFSMLKLLRKSEFCAWVKIASATITSGEHRGGDAVTAEEATEPSERGALLFFRPRFALGRRGDRGAGDLRSR